jgi:hypothetical protein
MEIIKHNKNILKISCKKNQYHYSVINTPQITMKKIVAQHNATEMEQNLRNDNKKLCKQVENKKI